MTGMTLTEIVGVKVVPTITLCGVAVAPNTPPTVWSILKIEAVLIVKVA
jgi:hypothetical protein